MHRSWALVVLLLYLNGLCVGSPERDASLGLTNDRLEKIAATAVAMRDYSMVAKIRDAQTEEAARRRHRASGMPPPGCESSGPASSSMALSPQSVAAIDWARGLYRDEARGSPRFLLMTTSNSGFVTFLLNWMCRARELGLKFVVHAQDTRLFETLSSEAHRGSRFKGGFSTFYEPWLSGTAQFGEFGGNTYLHTCCIKARVLLAVLELAGSSETAAKHTRQTRKGRSSSGHRRNTTVVAKGTSGVWFSDPDIAFLRDPTPWFEYGAGCDMQYQINDQNKFPVHVAAARLVEGSAFNSAGGGNSGFALWRYSPESLAIAKRVAEECQRGSHVPKACAVQYSSDQAVTWVVVTDIAEGKNYSKLGVPLPTDLQVKHWPQAANWRLAIPDLNGSAVGPSYLGGSGVGTFDICPLPLLTHAIGSYFKHPEAWTTAAQETGIDVVVAHANFIKGSHAKQVALSNNKAWALRADWKSDAKSNWKDSMAVDWPQGTCRQSIRD